MENYLTVITWSIIGGVFSLIGGLLLIKTQSKKMTWVRWALPFGAGTLLAVAILDLLPEALHEADVSVVAPWFLAGFLTFFLLERTVHWFHRHHEHDHRTGRYNAQKSLIILGDTIHNAIDGVAIGAAFLIDVPTGIVTSIAVASHEIPQEIADFGFLLSRGMRPRRVVLVNLLSSLATVVSAVTVFWLGAMLEIPISALLALAGGFFLYIAASDIIPEIHERPHDQANKQAVMLLLGVALIVAMTNLLPHGHAEVEATHEHDHGALHDRDTHDQADEADNNYLRYYYYGD